MARIGMVKGEVGVVFVVCAREGRNVTLLDFFTLPHSSQPSHTVLATNPHTLPHHALQTLHTPAHTYAITRGRGDGGLVAGSATTMRHRFLRKTHANNFRGVVCIYIQSPKHLESTSVVDFPHHQA